MATIPPHATLIKPSAIYAYFDKIQFWLQEPIDRRKVAQLRKQCGRGGVFVQNGPARFNARYRQRVEFRQPTDQALRWLAQREDALINRAEIALDSVFDYRADRDEAWEFLHRHLVRRWHGTKQEIRVYRTEPQAPSLDDDGTSGTRYDAGRSAPNLTALYRQECSRITGELNCLHLEWRLNGLKTVRGVGIQSGHDLPEFDHRQFWQKRLLLFAADKERLGRLINNQLKGRKSRISKTETRGRYRINIDQRMGDVHVRARETVQELIDDLGPSYRIHRALIPISNEVLLPDGGR